MTSRAIVTRRRFLAASAGLATACTIIPRSAFGANDRINVGCIGIGGKGLGEVMDVAAAGGNIVALCDVDENRRAKRGEDAREQHPDAKFYNDFRRLFDAEKNIDAVTVSTPDHTHFHPSMMAIERGIHVYCQKPLTHSVWEARQLAAAAKKHKVATQMGNQAHAGEPIRRGVEVVRAGLIGKVREVHTWTNRPIWPQGMKERPEPQAVPEGLKWDLWLGPAPKRPYNEAYVPFKWRGWWDFGTGALGDMGCHIIDMPYWALELGWPTSIEANAEGNTEESAPTASTVTWTFAPGRYSEELKYVWYDGNRMPPQEVTAEAGVPAEQVAKRFDLMMIGDKGKFFFGRGSDNWVTSPASLLDDVAATPQTIRRVESEDHEWLDACRGGPAALSNFDYAAQLTEMVLLGNVAIRLGRKIEYDGPGMKVPGCPEADALLRREYRKGWQM